MFDRPFVPNIDQPTAADNENEPYVPYYRYLLSQPTESLPQVISNSYGDEEDVSLPPTLPPPLSSTCRMAVFPETDPIRSPSPTTTQS